MAQRTLPRVEMERSTVEQYQRALLKLEQVSQADSSTSKKKRSTPASTKSPLPTPSLPSEYDSFEPFYASQPKFTENDLLIFESEERERNKKASETSRKRKLSDVEVEADEDDDDDPVCKALAEQQGRRQRRVDKSAFDGIFTRPKQTAVGVDYTLQDPYDAKFFHHKYCYQVKNMRLRRSRLGNKHYLHLLKLIELPSGEIKPGDRYSFPGDLLPGFIQVLGELENEIQAYL